MVDQNTPRAGHQSEDGRMSLLPPPWNTAVQVVGTYGLAVFLVLFYVFVMRPEDNNRYEKLATTVNEVLDTSVQRLDKDVTLLTEAIKGQQFYLTDTQARVLYTQYIALVAGRLNTALHKDLHNDAEIEDLEQLACSWMRKETNWLNAFVLPDGTNLHADVNKRICDATGICRRIAESAYENGWRDMEVDEIGRKLELVLHDSFALEVTPTQTANAKHAAPATKTTIAGPPQISNVKQSLPGVGT